MIIYEFSSASVAKRDLSLPPRAAELLKRFIAFFSHNPAILREASLGDYYLNGTIPSACWSAFFDAARIKKNLQYTEQHH